MARRKKYTVFTEWLQQCGKDSITLTFDELNDIVSIPPSALYDRPSWANCTTAHGTPFQHGWLDAGYSVTNISLTEKRVTFSKDNITVILITHNSALAPMADRLIRFKSGKVVEITENPNPTPIAEIEW